MATNDFAKSVAAFALQARPQPSGGGGGRGGYVGTVGETTKPGQGAIGVGLGRGFGGAVAEAFDPEVQRKRAVEARNFLLGMTDQQREIVIRDPRVQKQLKKYAGYMPMLFADARELTGHADLEGLLTVVDDKFIAQKYTAGAADIGLTGAQAESQLATAAATRGQEGRDVGKYGLEKDVLLKEAELKGATAAGLKQGTEEARKTEKIRAEAIEADTALKRQQKKESEELTPAQKRSLEAGAALQEEKKIVLSQEVQNDTDANIIRLEELAKKSEDAMVQNGIAKAAETIKSARDRLKFEEEWKQNSFMAMEYAKSANILISTLPAVYTPYAGKTIEIPRVLSDPSLLGTAYEAVDFAYAAMKRDKDKLTQSEKDELYRNVNEMFNNSFMLATKPEVYAALPPLMKNFLFGGEVVTKEGEQKIQPTAPSTGWRVTPYQMMNYIAYSCRLPYLTDEEKAYYIKAIEQAGDLEFRIEEGKRKRRSSGALGWGIGRLLGRE